MKKLVFVLGCASFNLAGITAAGLTMKLFDVPVTGLSAFIALTLALIATSAVNYFVTYVSLRAQVEQEVEDELFGDDRDESFEQPPRAGDVNFPAAQPRRFDEVNFK